MIEGIGELDVKRFKYGQHAARNGSSGLSCATALNDLTCELGLKTMRGPGEQLFN